MFNLMMVAMFVFLLTALGILIYVMIQNIRQWQRNNASPVLSEPATLVAKRSDVQHHAQQNGPNQMGQSYASTLYFATFELTNGQRIEFRLKNNEFGLLAEGDQGILTYQGTRYLDFERKKAW